MHSVLATVVAVVIFVVSWYLGGEVARFLDRLRGLGDSWLQGIFRELFVPGVAAYFGTFLATGLFKKSRVWNVFYMFAFTVVAIASFAFVFAFLSDSYEGKLISGFMFVAVLAGVVGSYIFAHNYGDRER